MAGIEALAGRLCARGGVVVLSGAGLSTESGIPDYRGPTGLSRRVTPMTYQAFTARPGRPAAVLGPQPPRLAHHRRAAPNAGHRAVAALQDAGLLAGVVTQNVDGLHQAAGARDVIELHGGLDRVICLDCGLITPPDGAGPAAGRGQPVLRRRGGARSTRTATSSFRTRRSTFRTVGLRAPATACSSRTWCSSARPCRANGYSVLRAGRGRPGAAWCWDRRCR